MQMCGRLEPPGTESIDHTGSSRACHTYMPQEWPPHTLASHLSDHIAIKKVKLPQTVKLVGAETDKLAITFILF